MLTRRRIARDRHYILKASPTITRLPSGAIAVRQPKGRPTAAAVFYVEVAKNRWRRAISAPQVAAYLRLTEHQVEKCAQLENGVRRVGHFGPLPLYDLGSVVRVLNILDRAPENRAMLSARRPRALRV